MGELAPGLGQNLWVTAAVLLAMRAVVVVAEHQACATPASSTFSGDRRSASSRWSVTRSPTDHGVEPRRTLVTVLTVAWAARLGIYLYWRNVGKGEDPRYTAAYRKRFPTEPALAHADQGVPAAGLSRVADLDAGPARAISGAAARARPRGDSSAWRCGRSAFCSRRSPTGSSRASRAIRRIAAACSITACGATAGTRTTSATPACGGGCGSSRAITWSAWPRCSAPILMTHFLLNVTGKKLLEKRMSRARPEYAAYVARTPGFFPWFPRRS